MNKIYYLLLQLIAIILIGWSFKLHKNIWNPTVLSNKIVNNGHNSLDHSNGNIFNAGVCQFGKISVWLIIIYIIITCFILLIKYTKKTILGIAISNLIMLSLLIIVSSFLNPQLSIRTIPFYLLEILIIIILFTPLNI